MLTLTISEYSDRLRVVNTRTNQKYILMLNDLGELVLLRIREKGK